MITEEQIKKAIDKEFAKQDYSNAPTLKDYGIKEADIILLVKEHEGTGYLYKNESGYHGFTEKLSETDMDKGGFCLIWEREEE
jgi:hypothetical protein